VYLYVSDRNVTEVLVVAMPQAGATKTTPDAAGT